MYLKSITYLKLFHTGISDKILSIAIPTTFFRGAFLFLSITTFIFPLVIIYIILFGALNTNSMN